ncbi:MAG: hypothetical protein ACO2OZ_01440 [Acidilobaceae archaeon]
MRILALGMLELMLGVIWGFVWSFYSLSLVGSGFDGLSYGVLGLSMSLATLLGYMACSLAYYMGSYRFVMPISATLIGLSYNALTRGELLELAPIMIGFALGGHTVSTIRTSSVLSQGNPRLVAYVYSLSLLGLSLGSLAVMLGYIADPAMMLVYSFVTGLMYQLVQRGGEAGIVKPRFNHVRLTRDLRLVASSSVAFIVVAATLGLAGGLSFYNMDYYMIVVFGVSEREIAFMLAISGLLAAIISLTPLNITRGNLWRVHAILVLAQTLLLSTLILAQSIGYAIAVYAIRTVIAVLADAVFDTIYTRTPPLKLADLRIPLVLTSWELSNGLGKLLGSMIIYMNPVIALMIASITMFLYSTTILIVERLHGVNRFNKIRTNTTFSEDPRVTLNLEVRGYPKSRTLDQVIPPPRYKV